MKFQTALMGTNLNEFNAQPQTTNLGQSPLMESEHSRRKLLDLRRLGQWHFVAVVPLVVLNSSGFFVPIQSDRMNFQQMIKP